MNMHETLQHLVTGEPLTQAQATAAFDLILTGEATPAQIGGILTALATRGETAAEIAGAATAMRAVSTKVKVDVPNLVDTCGTGGSGGAKRFNISTAAAFVAAAAGAHVAKHGNRGMTSKSGSADVLEAAGVELEISPEQVGRCISEVGVGFLFAVAHHPAMRFAGPVRRELGFRTLFNLLGPLTNPAGAKRQVIGVFSAEWMRPLAEVLRLLGAEHVLIVHSDGLDELSIHGSSSITELKNGTIETRDVLPSDFGIRERPIDDLAANSPEESLALVRAALTGRNEAAADIVALNAGAAIYAAGVATTMANGVTLAQDLISTGLANERLKELVDVTQAMVAAA